MLTTAKTLEVILCENYCDVAVQLQTTDKPHEVEYYNIICVKLL